MKERDKFPSPAPNGGSFSSKVDTPDVLAQEPDENPKAKRRKIIVALLLAKKK